MAKRWMVWIDGAGGFLLLPGDDWTMGGCGESDDVAIRIQGPLARREAAIRRRGADYYLQPLGTLFLAGRREERPTILRHGDRISIGNPGTPQRLPQGSLVRPTEGTMEANPMGLVTLEFTQPHPLSESARLQLLSRHRTLPHSEGIVLVADTCIIGATPRSHIRTPLAEAEVVLISRGGCWECRCASGTEIAGEERGGRVEIPMGVAVRTAGLSFSMEEIQ